MGEERKKILEKINESLKICEERLLQRLDNENNDEINENVNVLEENLTAN